MATNTEPHDCIIVGAGAAGLTAARALQAQGKRVLVLDKGRGVGGRMATRRIGEYRFDHGAQVLFGLPLELRFLLSDDPDRAVVRPCVSAPHQSEPGASSGLFAGVNGMSAIAKTLAEELAIETSVRITSIGWRDDCWHFASESGAAYTARTTILTPPVPQILRLMEHSGIELQSPVESDLRQVQYEPCLALLVTVDPQACRLDQTFVHPDGGCVKLLVDNHAKGVSAQPGAVTLHASAAYSEAMFEAPEEEIARQMLHDVGSYIDTSQATWQLHRWRYSQAVSRLSESYVALEQPGPLLFAGDGFGWGRIEGAVWSGRQAAEHLLTHVL
ncbi:FAD-dependent oxidoreductase [bacterium]|nr:FAD-dependent oxidoreductase [bacterium]